MATVTGKTSLKIDDLINDQIIDAEVDPSGNLLFETRGGSVINAGQVAPRDSPTFTGDPKAPTPPTADNDTSIATTAYVRALVAQELATQRTQLLLDNHPVGSIYFTESPTNPSSIFGGTWVAYGSGRVPVGVDPTQTEFDVVGKTGGEKKHTILDTELPPHTHGMTHTHSTPNHTHPGINTGGNTLEWENAALAAGTVAGVRAAGDASITVNSGGAGTTGGASASVTGSGPGTNQGANVLQPYITCYMWKRTA
jgi:microcystin-dependent protein